MASATTPASPGRILIVDDDAPIRSLIRRMLTRDGYQIEEAPDGYKALDLCATFHPHIVLLDIMMPGLDGFQVCTRLQALPDAERPTVLMITSLNDEQSINKAFEVGAVDHIAKPIQWPILRHRVQHLVRAWHADAALRNTRDELENRVAERTTALEQANAELVNQMSAREQAEERQRTLSAGLRNVLIAANELITSPDMDTLHRRAVELAREKLGVERCGLFLERDDVLWATYGTDRDGNTIDEHGASLAKDQDLEQEFRELAPEDAYAILQNIPFTAWIGGQRIQFGEGWVGFTPIKSGDRIIGALFNDTAITGAPVDPSKQAILGIFCSILGNIIEHKQAKDDLRKAHDELEARVSERTAQLAEINEKLQAEIVERAQAEQAVEEERNLLRTLIDHLPDYIFIKDLDGRFVISNMAHTRATQKPVQDEVVGKTALDTFPPELALQYHADDQAVIQSGEPLINVERRTVDAAGNQRWVLTTKVPLRDRAGFITGLVGMSRDITERKQMDETLRQSEQRFRSAFDDAPIGMALVSLEGRWLKVNRALCDIVGYSEASLLANTFQDITHPDDLDADLELVRQMLAGEILSYQMEKRYIHKLGHSVWVMLSVSLVRTPTGEPLYFIGQIQDISERKRLENEIKDHREHLESIVEHRTAALTILNESLQEEIAERRQIEKQLTEVNDHLSLILESVPVATYTARTDRDFGATYMGKSVTGMTGYRPEEHVANPSFWLSHVHPDDKPMVLAGIQRLLEMGFYEYEYRWQVADGSYRWFWDVMRLVEAPDGTRSIVGIWHDISSRKRTEEALLNSEQQLRRITDNMLDMIWQTDVAGMIEFASPSCLDVLGYRPEVLVGKSIYSWVHPEDIEHVREGIRSKGQVEYRYRHANGAYVWLETLSNLLFENSAEANGIIFASRDITERKQAQRELEELNRLKTEFLSTAAHELRTPLTSIRGFTEILLMRELDAPRRKQYMTLISEQAAQLGRLIDDLLDISRLEATRTMTLNMEPVQIRDLIDQAVKPFVESSPRHQFLVEGSEGCPSIVGDPARLAQVLTNLVGNAVKYSPKGGTIRVRAQPTSDHVELSVQDEGIGISPEQQVHLFEKFYRADASNTAIGGTGLGLNISKQIVELHGGQIWVKSEYGVGTTFFFTLPLSQTQVPMSA
jgi:PAS domain S-box-containing protein